jgi:hypothetical protein
MLTQLNTVKSRLSVDAFDVKYDSLLILLINAVSQRFDKECNRTFARTTNLAEEFSAEMLELCPACYPIESVTGFDLKSSEAIGWVSQTGVDYLIRRRCVISLARRIGGFCEQARVTYTGGFVLPGATVGVGQTALPADVEQAALEQVVWWFQNRDRLGLVREWPKGAVYLQFAQVDLLIQVQGALRPYVRLVA